jgi:hypothetical protein
MHRAVVFVFPLTLLSIGGCHRSQAAPKETAPQAAADSSTTAAELALDSGDPAVLSRTAETSAQIDPALAIGGEGAVAIGWLGVRPGKSSLVGARVSRDLGVTWSSVQALLSPDGRTAADPAAGVTARGDVLVAWLGYRPDPASGERRDAHVYVARAEPEASELGAPVDVSEPMRRGTLVDKPSLAISPSGTALVIWRYTADDGNGIGIARGDADGRWLGGKVIERVGLQAWLPSVCASAHGERVWVAYVDGEAGVRVRASDDGAVSWSPARAATVSLSDEKPRIAIEMPTCAGDGDDVAVAYGRTREGRDDGRSPGLDSIVIARSFDGGRTYDWRRTIEMPSDAVALHPQLVREPDGTLDVAFYQANAGADAGDAASLKYVRLEKGAASASAPRVVSDHVRIARDRKSPMWPGDSLGLAWHDGKLYVASIDATGDLSHVAFAGIAAK